MTTKKPEGEQLTEQLKREEAARRDAEKPRDTEDPLASPDRDVHAPNPPSEGEK